LVQKEFYMHKYVYNEVQVSYFKGSEPPIIILSNFLITDGYYRRFYNFESSEVSRIYIRDVNE
jgi:hypothetical protein